ncbi:hypothetical protein ACFL3I_00945 [Pseudomonadota bacterium]
MRGHRLLSGSLLVFCTLILALEITSGAEKKAQEDQSVSLSELATKADLVAIAQVKDTDYVFTRSFPSEGSAYLKILIAYKANRPGEEIIEVYEKGLHPNECYFENPTVFEEGRRYLVFFRNDPEDPEIYRGFPEGCALEILVSKDNRYALKYPIKGLNLADKLDELATDYDFRDNYALVSEESLSPAERDDLLSRGLIVPYQDKFKYTHGIDLTTARKLITTEALKPDINW